ncbi:MAG: histidine phosphatase family protein [Microbacteriaceae bacterium]
MSRFIYLVRHGEQQNAEHGLPDGPLTEKGRKQAELLADRLARVPFTHAYHSPLERAQETANIISSRLDNVQSEPSVLLLDCYPSGPSEDMPASFERFFGGVSEAELAAGSAQMADAVDEWLSPSKENTHELLVTHNFVISWLAREAMDAPSWRWLTMTVGNCSLSVIKVRSGRPNALMSLNDIGHLPPELRTFGHGKNELGS